MKMNFFSLSVHGLNGWTNIFVRRKDVAIFKAFYPLDQWFYVSIV